MTAAAEGWYVTVEFNSHADGTPVAPGDEVVPVCHYGPFADGDAADHWMNEVYPDDDTDVADMWAHRSDPDELGVVNAPEVVIPR